MYTELEVVIQEKWSFHNILRNGEEIEIGKRMPFDISSQKFIRNFKEQYRKFLKVERREEFRQEYIFDSRKIELDEIFEKLRDYDKKIGFSIYTNTCYEQKDYEDAKAFLISFPKECFYYDDGEDDEPFNSQVVPCKSCFCRDHADKIYIRPNNGLKKQFERKAMGASTDNDLEIISFEMYDYLISNGVSEKLFKPVFQKNGQMWAYSFYECDNFFPSFSVFSEDFSKFKKCEVCGRIDLLPQSYEKTNSIRADIKEALNIGAYPISERKEIQSDVLKEMADVNSTSDYIGGKHYIVFSKKIFELLKVKIPKLEKTCEPIFEGHWKPRIDGDKIIRVYE